jgi:hypothetical protein
MCPKEKLKPPRHKCGKGAQHFLHIPSPFLSPKMAASSIFRANFGTFHPLLFSFIFEKVNAISVIAVSEPKELTPVQVVVLASQIEETGSAKAPRIQLARCVGSPEPLEP